MYNCRNYEEETEETMSLIFYILKSNDKTPNQANLSNEIFFGSNLAEHVFERGGKRKVKKKHVFVSHLNCKVRK